MVYVSDMNVGVANPDNDGVVTDAERARWMTYGFSVGFVESGNRGRGELSFVIFEELASDG